jgi:hypothetical protein
MSHNKFKPHKGEHKHTKERDPIADYKEWTEHRYDPGYFTGGRLPPGIRGMQALFSTRERRVLFTIIVIVVVGAVAWRLWTR